ncbi:MAG TPA: DUF2341 domain-containing protein [Chryseolinea sp.]|nr:DUF2341 domain-containing protein [Chryseolinea sp.]
MSIEKVALKQAAVCCLVIAALHLSATSAIAQVCGYYYSKTITINGSQISGGPHTNFPVLISHTDPALATAAAKVTNANGYDIIFTDNSGNALDFQLERYTAATGQIVAWVKVPSITNGTNTTVQIRYGNAAVTTNQSTTNTWSSGYSGVWHFNNSVGDASANNYTSTNNGSTNQGSGKIGDARNFVNPNQWVELPTFPNVTTNFTISGWIYSNDVSRDGQRIFADDVNNTGGYAFSLGDEASPGRLRFYSRNSNPVSVDAGTFLLSNNTWYHVAAVADITGSIKRIYVNGVERVNGAYTNAWGTDAGNASIGGETAAGEPANRFHGNLDEIRVATRALSAGWLASEYNSQNQPTTTVGVSTAGDFYTVGSEVTYGDPSQFGSNTWNVYAYNGNNASDALNSYRGFYQHSTLNFNSTALWPVASNPGTATGYAGCTVNDDVHTVRYKRRGFTCGYYQIDIAGHDDGAELFVNGASVWSHNGCCDTHLAAWSGFLGANTTVEFRWTDTAADSYGAVNFSTVPFPTLTPPVTICAGTTTTLTASGAANYSWTPNTTYMTAPFNTASKVVSPPGATPNSTQTYTVQTTDATTGCTASNSVVVTINPLPTTVVTPTTATFCTSGSVVATATGANTYTWSPMTGVSGLSPSGHQATLAPTTTTTYTVTGSNNCSTNTATVTITVNTITGNPAVFGSNTWNVYAYTGDNFDTYSGYYIHNTLSFDSRTLWGVALSPSSAPGYTGCIIPVDNHSYRYKRQGFNCGYYQLDIPNHDDNVVLYVNGVEVFRQDSWDNNTATPNVWSGYLTTTSTVEYTIREFAGDSHAGLTLNYVYGPQNGAAETVWNAGAGTTNWFTAGNWCGSVPSPTVGAYIPSGMSFAPVIAANGAQVLDLTIGTTATLTQGTAGTARNLEVYGDWTNNGTFTPAHNNSQVILSGASAITVGGTGPTTFTDLRMNNSNPNAVTLQQNIIMTSVLTFTDGHITTGSNMVIFNDGATVTGASNNSHVSGAVRKIGNDTFAFPVGKSDYYAPISLLTTPNNASYYYTAEYFFTDPNGAGYSTTSLGAGVNHVSRNEFWSLTSGAGASTEQIQLSWNTPRSGGVTNANQLRVVGWTGTQWADRGNAANTATGASGTINSPSPIAAYGILTLGSSTANNPLPVELLKFDARLQGDHVLVSWQTATEKNNDFFTVKKSTNGKDWHLLEKVPGNGTTLLPTSYSIKDLQPVHGLQYYQLTQTDFDGQSETFPIISLNVQKLPERGQLTLYPNPTEDEITIRVTSIVGSTLAVQVTDVAGRMYMDKTFEEGYPVISAKELPAGVYIVSVFDGRQMHRAKFVRK